MRVHRKEIMFISFSSTGFCECSVHLLGYRLWYPVQYLIKSLWVRRSEQLGVMVSYFLTNFLFIITPFPIALLDLANVVLLSTIPNTCMEEICISITFSQPLVSRFLAPENLFFFVGFLQLFLPVYDFPLLSRLVGFLQFTQLKFALLYLFPSITMNGFAILQQSHSTSLYLCHYFEHSGSIHFLIPDFSNHLIYLFEFQSSFIKTKSAFPMPNSTVSIQE